MRHVWTMRFHKSWLSMEIATEAVITEVGPDTDDVSEIEGAVMAAYPDATTLDCRYVAPLVLDESSPPA